MSQFDVSEKGNEKGRGISLRKKRTVKPKIGAPKQISGPLPPGASPLPTSNGAGPRPGGLPGGLPSQPRQRSSRTTRLQTWSSDDTRLASHKLLQASAMAPLRLFPLSRRYLASLRAQIRRSRGMEEGDQKEREQYSWITGC